MIAAGPLLGLCSARVATAEGRAAAVSSQHPLVAPVVEAMGGLSGPS